VRSASQTQHLTSLLKVFAFLVFVAVCFASPPPILESARPLGAPTGLPLLVASILAMQAVIFTFDGWNGPAYFAGELRNPGRELPRSIFGGVLAVILIYLLLNVALLHVLPISKLANDPFALATAMAALFGARGDLVVHGLVILSLLSAINAYLMFTSRTFYALSGQLGFATGQRANAGGTPTTGLLASALAAALFLVSGTYQRIIAITAFLFVANYTFTYVSLFALRWREPAAARPFRAWGHPWTTGFVLLVSLAFLVGALVTDTRNSLVSIALLVLSYPVFRILRRRNPAVGAG
jgi:APA family basic amino acid/polyamine antiporter